jgi:hypothetical protein
MSFAFIPVPSENPLFNEKTVNEKWNKFMDKLCSDIITTLELKTSDISKIEISDIITENLNKHYFIQSTSATPTPTKESKSKKSSTPISKSVSDEEEEEEPTPAPKPTPTKTKTTIKKVSKKQPEPEPEEQDEVESDPEEEVLKPKKEIKKSKKEEVKEEDSVKVDKDRCSEILKNNSQCKGKAVLGSTMCSRHNKKSK